MKFNRSIYLVIFTTLLSCNLVYSIYLHTQSNHSTNWNYFYSITYGSIYFLAGLIPLIYIRNFGLKSNLGKSLLFIGLSMLCNVAGQAIWAYYNIIHNGNIPYFALVLADIGFVLFYPFMALGCYFLLSIYKQFISRNIVRNIIIFLILSFIIIFGFFARPDITSNITLLEKIVNVFYPVGDVILLTIVITILRLSGGKLHPALYFFALGLFLVTSGDLLFAYQSANNTYWNGNISDIIYTFAGYFIGVSMVNLINNLKS